MAANQIVTGTLAYPPQFKHKALYVFVDSRDLAVPYEGTRPEGTQGRFELVMLGGVRAVCRDAADGR